MSNETVYLILPEIVLLAAATMIYVGGAFAPLRRWGLVAVAALVVSGFALLDQYEKLFWPASDATVNYVSGPLAVDLCSHFVRWLSLVCGLLFVLAASGPRQGPAAASEGEPAPLKTAPTPEILGSILMAVSGLMLVASARELVLFFVGLELVSIPTYVLLYLGRRETAAAAQAAQESAAKYFFLSILSSAILLYGFSFLYGVGGSTELARIGRALAAGSEVAPAAARIALVLIFAGLAFRIAAAPFHFYAPDVYQGATNLNAGLLSVLPKIAGITALVRIVVVALPGLEPFGWRLALILSVLTMTIGNVVALWQTNIRRLLAYSSIAHSGYMLIGLAVAFTAAGPGGSSLTRDGVEGALLYLAVYALATTGAFVALVWLTGPERQVDDLEELAGLGTHQPLAAAVLAICMFSLAGIPPLAGFWGKLSLFTSALAVDPLGDPSGLVRSWFIGLAIVGVINAAIAATYYLRVVAVMYFKPAVTPQPATGGNGARFAMLAAAVLVIGAGLFPFILSTGASTAAQSARSTASGAWTHRGP